MGFLGVYRAIYDYEPQAEGELAIGEGDLLYVLDKNDDDGWWKAKRKAGTDEDDEPEGLVPNNYLEPVSARSYPSPLRSVVRSRRYANFNRLRRSVTPMPFTSILGRPMKNCLSQRMPSLRSLTTQTLTGSLPASTTSMGSCHPITST